MEKSTLLEEKRKFEEVVELTERAKELESEVNKLRDRVEALIEFCKNFFNNLERLHQHG